MCQTVGVYHAPRLPLEKVRVDNETSVRMAEKSFAWEPLLRTWSQERLTSAEYRSVLPDEVIASEWLGYPGAREKEITSAEQRLAMSLPPSYWEFLRVTNGWRRTSPFIERVWSVEQVKSFAIENQEWIDIWRDTDPDCPEARYLPSAVQISEVGDAAVYLLMPELASGNGECEVRLLASWRGTAVRYDSFWDLMQAEYATFKSIEHPGKIEAP